MAMQKTVCGKKPISKEKIQKFEETNKYGKEKIHQMSNYGNIRNILCIYYYDDI